MNLTEMAAKLRAEREAIAALFNAAKQEDGTFKMSAEEVTNLHKRNDDLTVLQQKYDEQLKLEGIERNVRGALEPQGRAVPPEQPGAAPGAKVRTFEEIVGANPMVKHIAAGGTGSAAMQLSGPEWKTLLTLSDIYPQPDRQPVVPSAQFLADVTGIFQPGRTTSNSIDYFVESTYTNNAAEVSEGSANTDAALDFTLTADPVQEINVWIPITRQALDDVPQLQSYVTGRLDHMLATRRSAELLVGDGTAPNISGILDRSGLQTQAKGADPTMDAVHKAITKVAVTGDAVPDNIVFHPNDWQDIRLTRTVDGIYILGNPSEAAPTRLWGLPVTVSASVTENTAIVGAFRSMAQVFIRDGVTVEVSTEHSDYFTKRQVALLLYQRLALAVYRPAAFCSVTGI